MSVSSPSSWLLLCLHSKCHKFRVLSNTDKWCLYAKVTFNITWIYINYLLSISYYNCDHTSIINQHYLIKIRLGGGLFGRLTGFPHSGASWSGCGSSGDYLDQLVFLIANGNWWWNIVLVISTVISLWLYSLGLRHNCSCTR